MKQPLLKNVGELAESLGVNRTYVTRMKYAGFAMPGGRSTIDWALQWLKEHPDFSQAASPRQRRDAQHRAPSTSGK